MLQKIRVGRLLLGFGLAWFCLLLWPAPAWAEEGSAVLRMEAGRSVLAGTAGGERIWVALPPEDIFLLNE